MPSAPRPVTSTPDVPGQPYDATAGNTISKWVSVNPKSGPADSAGNATGPFEHGPGKWQQT
jgi:hypothetical protein